MMMRSRPMAGMWRISYDPTEGVVRMEVIAATPEDSERFLPARC